MSKFNVTRSSSLSIRNVPNLVIGSWIIIKSKGEQTIWSMLPPQAKIKACDWIQTLFGIAAKFDAQHQAIAKIQAKNHLFQNFFQTPHIFSQTCAQNCTIPYLSKYRSPDRSDYILFPDCFHNLPLLCGSTDQAVAGLWMKSVSCDPIHHYNGLKMVALSNSHGLSFTSLKY